MTAHIRSLTRLVVSATIAFSSLSCSLSAERRVADRSEVVVRADARSPLFRRRAPERRRVSRRAEQTRLQPRIMPMHDHFHPLIQSKAMGSIAVGTNTQGYLARAAELPFEGPHHAILPKVRKRHTRFTTDEMRSLLLCVAERVAQQHPGHKLFLGNLSRQGGGDIPWSVSHNNGRDADIAFLATNPDGSPAKPDFLYHFDRTLEATDSPSPMRFDVAANWTMVKALLQCPKSVTVQKLFIARWLRYPILRYARAVKEPVALRAAAARMLRQPRRTSPHSDHLHLRIGCPDDDLAEGCVERGRASAEAVGQHPRVRARLPKIRAALRSDDPVERAAAAYLSGLYFDAKAIGTLAKLLEDASASVRLRATQALFRTKVVGMSATFAAALSRETDPRVAMKLAGALVATADVDALGRLLADRSLLSRSGGALAITKRNLILQQLGESESLAATTWILPLLTDPEPAVRNEAQRALERLVNRSTADLVLMQQGVPTADGITSSLPMRPPAVAALWQQFLASIPRTMQRDELALQGFQGRGLPITAFEREELNSLAVALSWESPYRDNAARYIARAIDYFPELGRGSRAHPRAFWMPFLSRRGMIDPSVVARGVLAAETSVAGTMSVPAGAP